MTNIPWLLRMGVGWRMYMTAELVDRLTNLVAIRRFPGVGGAEYCSLRTRNYVCMRRFVRRSTSINSW
jgi:hypothetical protein